jgi:aminoglycoside 3-N-acetyltransferase I
MEIVRLTVADVALARRTFELLAGVFDEQPVPLGDAYLRTLLARPDFWALAARVDDEVLGGLTAHALPMTRAETGELFLYDLGVRADWRRRGVGRALVDALRDQGARAGIGVVFVPADGDDTHALDFYRALGGAEAPVAIFTFER